LIKNILYDFGYVLAYPRSGNWFIPPNARKILGLGNYLSVLSRVHKIGSSFQLAHQYLNENHLLFTEEEEINQFTGFYRIMLEGLGVKKHIDQLAGELARDNVCNDDKFIFYEDVHGALEKARAAFRIGVLSDTWPSLKRVFDHQGITPLLSGLIMSCDYGICKDNIELFYKTVKKLEIKPEETAFIDDALSNLDNAAKAGFYPILMDRKRKVKQSQYPLAHNLEDAYQIVIKYNSSVQD
jgi:putative hydrolase of the HAD superfamily